MKHSGKSLRVVLAAVIAVLTIGSTLLAQSPALADNTAVLPPSNRVSINLGETPWRYLKDIDPSNAMSPTYDDSSANTSEVWTSVGVPYTPSDNDTFLNLPSGGGQGQLTGNINWYRKHFSLDASYANRKIFVEFEGAHMGAQVYINGQFIQGNSLINPQATHVIGFVPFIVDITNFVKFDGTDNVLAVKVARGDSFFISPNFSGAFRFGQADSGLFRPVWMYITDRVHIPRNTYSVVNTWGTYVSTLSANDTEAVVRVQTNVLNEYSTSQPVTLNTQIVDANGNVVASAQSTQALASSPQPVTPAENAPTTAPPAATFDQTLTVANPTLWYPNNSLYGSPYLYTVVHTVSINGLVVDATTTPLGIRTIAWDQNFPIINGHPHYLWGASGRYDYPALGSAVPAEQQWRDVSLLATAGGSLYRPGHSSQGPDFLAAADAYGVMMIQPSGDGENGFATLCPGTVYVNGCTASTNDVELKEETHRDMIVHDRNNPSVLAWEADNGATDTSFAQNIKALSQVWDPVLTRAQSDRTPNPANGDILGCSGDGCDVGVKTTYPNSPTWGSEYWGDGVYRANYDYELAFAAPYINNWVKSVALKSFGIAHWYLADTPGEITTQIDGPDSSVGTAAGPLPAAVRGNGASMMDAKRIPRLLYSIYQSAWTPYSIKPVVKLAYHWNRSGNIRVNAFSNCPAVRLLINGQRQGSDQVPNAANSDASGDLTENTTLLPMQVHWDVTWASGTVTAQCIDNSGRPVLDANGNQIADQQVTAGAPDHINLSVTPELVRPDGTQFNIQANGSDAAFVTATVVDANNNIVPTASNILTFSVTGPGTYRGGTDHFVTPNQPQGYHAPGDPNLSAEGGATRIAVKSQFTPGIVTVSATASGLGTGTTSFAINPITGPAMSGGSLPVPGQAATALAIVTPPQSQTVTVGQTATFTVLSAGTGPLTYQWLKSGVAISGATGYSYTTPATTLSGNGATYSVTVSNGASSVTSSTALLTVVTPTVPSILTQPLSVTVVAGQTAEFSAAASGSPTLAYQWSKNGTAIQGANSSVYDTPIVASSDNGSTFQVTVTNSAGSVTSNAATLTVSAATAPSIVTAPHNQAVSVNQLVELSVVASGTAPLHYQWALNGNTVGTDQANYIIAAAQSSDAGSYTVTVTNAAGSITSAPAVLSVSGNNGTNLAQGKTASESSEQNGGLTAAYAFDGSVTTRWSSAPSIDPSWIAVDLGSVQTFDEVVLVWENAYASQYQLQVSNDNQTWTTLFNQTAGLGGTETIHFASTSARYVRMYGTQRATQYGYSLFEFQVYDVPQCGGLAERFTVNAAQSGTYNSTISGIPSGPYVPTVTDNLSNLTWQQYVTTFTAEGAQFTQPIAAQYCSSVGMRLPSQNEAQTVAGTNYSSCAFPDPWTTWTTTAVPGQAGRAYFVSSDGTSSSQIIDNSPGWALCVSGQSLAAPAITAQPANQSAPLGSAAQFTVAVSGTGPISYQWYENSTQVGITTVPSFTTAAVQASDNGAAFTVVVSNGGGSVTSAAATLTVTAATSSSGGGNTGGGNGGGTTTTTTTPSTNLALTGTATASGVQSSGYPASAAIDGNLGSRWASAFVDPSWITVDLGSAQTVNRVVLRWEASYGVAYQIQTSTDNSNWTTVFTQTAGQGGNEDISFASTSARYVRMYGTKRSSQYGYSLYEFEIYNTANTPQFPVTVTTSGNGTVTPNGSVSIYQGGGQTFTFLPATGYAVTGITVDGQTAAEASSYSFSNVLAAHTLDVTFGPAQGAINLALNQPATSSGNENAGLGPTNAVDGNLNTRWSSAWVDPSWIEVDLGSAVPFNRVVLNWQAAYGVAYQIQASNDNQNWTTVYTQTAGKGGIEDFSFSEVTARYIRMYGTKRSSGYGYSLWEFQVYDMPTPPVLTTEPVNQSAAVGTTAQFSVAATGTKPLSYQWYENGALVGTTASPTFTTAALTAADNAATFDVVVSNVAGSVTSANATLTVTGLTSGSGGTGGTGGSTGTTAANANLALAATATASGVESNAYPPSNAIDGNLGSRWSSAFVDPSWIALDLGSPQTFNRVVLRWENAHAIAYEIDVSNDNQNWTSVYTQTASQGGDEDIGFPAVNARYVRMYGTQRSTQYGYSLYEFEIYNTTNTPKFAITATANGSGTVAPAGASQVYQGADPSFSFTPASGYAVTDVVVDGQDIGPQQAAYTFRDVQATHNIAVTFGPLSASVNLAQGTTATASGVEGAAYPPSNAIDGNLNTRWSSAFVDPSWITVDLGTIKSFNRVVLDWQNAFGVAYQIQTSTDNQNWTTVFTQSAGQGGTEDITFATTSARYVRMYGTQRATQYGYSLWEFQIYNTASQVSALPSITTQPQAQTVGLGQSAAFSVAVTGTGPFTYQWQENGANISGATEATYSTPVAQASDNGATFDVVVSNAAGPVTSQTATLTVNSTPLPYTVYPGFVGVDLQNNTNGAYTDDQVYVAVIGLDPATGQFAWLKPDGTITDATVADNTAAGSLTANGQNYSNYFFTLAQSKQLKIPQMNSGRVFISLGSPLYIKILADANGNIGYAGPNPLNATDPNINIYYDWYEFSYNNAGLWINTTQVDEFGLPMLLDVYGSNNTFHKQTGINQSRASLYSAYLAETPAAFHLNTLSPYRIMAPANDTFDVGQANANYFDPYIAQIWTYYTSNTLTVNLNGSRSFAGQVQGGQMVFTEVDLGNGAYVGGTYTVNQPTTQDVLRGAGTLATGNSTELALEAQMCAAFNRHIMNDATQWATPGSWYSASPANWYAKFWHDHSVGGLAYGFAYDDVSNQSSTIQAGTPEHAVFGIGF